MRVDLANEIGCQNASASIVLTQRIRLPLELYSGKSLLMCFLYLLKIFSYANIGGVAGYSATVKGVATQKSLGTTAIYHLFLNCLLLLCTIFCTCAYQMQIRATYLLAVLCSYLSHLFIHCYSLPLFRLSI